MRTTHMQVIRDDEWHYYHDHQHPKDVYEVFQFLRQQQANKAHVHDVFKMLFESPRAQFVLYNTFSNAF